MTGRVTCSDACLHLHLDFHHTHPLLFSYNGLGSLLRSGIVITESQIYTNYQFLMSIIYTNMCKVVCPPFPTYKSTYPLILSAYFVTLY